MWRVSVTLFTGIHAIHLAAPPLTFLLLLWGMMGMMMHMIPTMCIIVLIIMHMHRTTCSITFPTALATTSTRRRKRSRSSGA